MEESSGPPMGFDEATADDVAHLLWMAKLDPRALPADLAQSLASRENSFEATGTRMADFMRHLIAHAVTHTPDRRRLYEQLVPYCERLSPLQAYTMRQLLGRQANEGYEEMPADVHLEFPRDHELKLRAQVGWHFFVGSLWDEDGTEYGVELMFFGEAMFPPDLAAGFGLTDLANQYMEVQFALSRRGDRHHQAEPIVAAGTSGLITASADPFSMAVGRNEMVSEGVDGLLPMRLRAWGVDRGSDPEVELAVDLRLSSGKGVLAQGDDGAMPSVSGQGTFYYSIPNIAVDGPASTLRIGPHEVRLARGVLWFDHQWGRLSGYADDEVLRAADNVSGPGPAGWDWFMAQLDGDRQFTMFAMHDKEHAADFYDQDGPTAPGVMERRVGAKYMSADGSTSAVWGTMHVTDWVRTEHSPDPDRYPPTHTWHPNRWEFTFDDVPDEISTFTMEPIVAGGQSAFFAHGAQICEGAVVLLDPSGVELGRGFAESVAYADTTRNQLRLAGLPVTDDMVALVKPAAPRLAARLRNMMFVLAHRKELAEVVGSAKGLEYFSDPDNG